MYNQYMEDCKFTRYYTEPNHKYTCLSTSLFIVEKYIKRTKNNQIKNVLDNKINLFFENTIQKCKHLLDGHYPKNYYMRIYYDDSIEFNKKISKLFTLLKKHPKVQLIKFNCPKFKENKISHINLFGTVMRFHVLFDQESPNIDLCILIDADAIYTKNFIEEVEKFRHENYYVMTFNSIYQLPFYYMDSSKSIDEYQLIDKTHFPGGLTICKKIPLFSKIYWNKYLENMFEQFDLLLQYNYLDFKRFGIKNDTDYIKQSYYSFNYGFDEIWLNYIIKKILKNNNHQDKIKVILFKIKKKLFFIERLSIFLEYNLNRNTKQFEKFLEHCDFLEEKTYDKLDKYLKNINNEKQIKQFVNNIKKNPYFNHIYMQDMLRYIIINYEKLITQNIRYHNYNIYSQNKVFTG